MDYFNFLLQPSQGMNVGILVCRYLSLNVVSIRYRDRAMNAAIIYAYHQQRWEIIQLHHHYRLGFFNYFDTDAYLGSRHVIVVDGYNSTLAVPGVLTFIGTGVEGKFYYSTEYGDGCGGESRNLLLSYQGYCSCIWSCERCFLSSAMYRLGR